MQEAQVALSFWNAIKVKMEVFDFFGALLLVYIRDGINVQVGPAQFYGV